MKKSSLNLFGLFLPFVLAFFLFNLFAYFTDFYSTRFGRIFSHDLGPKVTIERVWISPLEGIKITGITFHDEQGQAFSTREIILKYSFQEISRGRLAFKRIFINDAKAHIRQGQEIPSLNYLEELRKVGTTYGQKGLPLVFEGARICFNKMYIRVAGEGGAPDTKDIVLDFCLDYLGDKVRCDGKVSYAKSSWVDSDLGPQSLSFRNIGFLWDAGSAGNDLFVNQIKVFTSKYTFVGSGVIQNFVKSPKVDIKIYSETARLEKAESLAAFHPRGGELGIIGHLTGNFGDLKLSAELLIPIIELTLDKEVLSLDQLSCQVVYSSKNHSLVIKGLRGLIDGSMQFFIAGDIAHIASPLFNLRGEIVSLTPKKEVIKNSKVLLAFRGGPKQNGITGSASILLADVNGRQYLFSLRDFSLIKKITGGTEGNFLLRGADLNLSEITVVEGQKKKAQEFEFGNLKGDIRFVGKKTFIDSFSMDAYGGKITLKGYSYFNRDIHDSHFAVQLNTVGLKGAKLTYPVYCEATGIVSGDIDVRNNNKGTYVKGGIAAANLNLAKLEPLDKVADFIGIKSIKMINNADLLVAFDLSPAKSLIERFDLDSAEMGIRSNFNINKEQWLEGEVALSLPRKTLEESKIFKKLLAIARERQNLLDFVVRVSGISWQLRTELVKSDFRDKLKEKISTGIQQYIEGEANKAMEEKKD